MKRLMADAAHVPRPFDVVVVNEGRTIGRTGRAFWRWAWALEDMGIFVAIVDADIDSTTVEGRREMRRQADRAEAEYQTIRTRTQSGLQEKAQVEDSPHIGGRPPYGYRIHDKGRKGNSHLVVAEDEAATIRRVFSMMVTENLTLRQIAIRLHAEGIKCRSGVPWSSANLRDRILSRAVLDGEMIFRGDHAQIDANGKPVRGESIAIALPRILTEDQADRLRAAAAERARKSGRRRSAYPLTGRLISLCNTPCTGASNETMAHGRRNYRCNGKFERIPGQRTCDCSYLAADPIEARVWSEVVTLLGNVKGLGTPTPERVDMTGGSQTAHAHRIADLDRQINGMNAAIAAVRVASAKQQQSADALTAATKALREEVELLVEMRAEAAAWLGEIEDFRPRAVNLLEITKLTRDQLAAMTLEEQAEILALLHVKVTVEGPVPLRRTGMKCTVEAWYRAAKLDVPASDLSDDEWRLIAPLLPKGRNGRVRRSVEAIFAKARRGVPWPALRAEYGSTSTASQHFNVWSANGTWERINAVLADVTRVPLPELDLVPPIRIEARIDQRVMLITQESFRTEQ
ncbi:transposase [Kitasatospora indigofera]|uniref:transposase n=1 Tax=Kitasatospora indigofera TaxID=67307 RepID=UPI001E5A0B90|nr:transposase [Kitasatospora indigofera]